ncbi:nitroreductase family protein [uncultured Fluviicola sp.]|uniref:nitroreductase family protein n=1 Tax=uncultured Fluviicola sp. TaxID=463303 RepID=UPI0025DA95D6|nr:nitroreductase family protein [uncultured Fluviicola sp.]
MNFITLANSRYTTKKYDPTQKVSAEKIEQLKEILRLSPSSINSQPWKFTIISDEALKAELAAASYFNEQKIKDASHLVVFSSIDDISQFEKQISQHLPEGSVTYYTTFLKPLPEAEIKSWLQSQVYLSLGFFLGACASMDIDSSPMEGIQADKYAEILKLNGYKPLFAVAIGYRNPEDANQPSVKPKSRLEMDLIIDVV